MLKQLFTSLSASNWILILTCQQTPLYIKDGHTIMAAVSFNYAYQMRYPVY